MSTMYQQHQQQQQQQWQQQRQPQLQQLQQMQQMHQEQEPQYRILLRDLNLLEKDLLNNDPSSSSPSSSTTMSKDEIQKQMIQLCHELIINYPQIASTKNVDNILWKHCYYRNIEAFRKRIRQLSTILEKPYTRSPAIDAQYQEHRQNLLKISSALNQYLSQSAAFYESFLMQLENLIESKSGERDATTDAAIQTNLSLDLDAYLKSVYFCLLYLGDIARYTELHSMTNKPKDWSAASQYYLRARQVLPSLGNSHNQLAVLCSYKATQSSVPANLTPGLLTPPNQDNNSPPPASVELNAIYHYCRSILVDIPFQTGVENLKLMFEKSAKRSASSRQPYSSTPMNQSMMNNYPYDEYDRRLHPPQQHLPHQPHQHQQSSSPYMPSHYSGSSPYPSQSQYQHGKKSKQALVDQSNISEFISIFLSIMNEIFSLSLSELSLSLKILTSKAEEDFKVDQINEHQTLANKVSNVVGNLFPKLLDEFELLFSNLTSQLSAEVLIRILTISLFSIHFTRHELKRKSKHLDSSNSFFKLETFLLELQENRFLSESLGISCLFSLVSRLALKLCNHNNVDKTKRRLMIRVLQFFSIFCDWGRMNPYYLHSVNSTSTLQQSTPSTNLFFTAIETLRASGEQLRGENRTRSSLRVTVADMKAYLLKLFSNNPNDPRARLGSHMLPISEPTRPVFGHILSLPLPEYIELRGYIPLNNYEIFFRGIPLKTMISISYPSEKDNASITRRIQNIEEFIDFSLAPPVPPPPVLIPPPTETTHRTREDKKNKRELRKKEKKLKQQRKEKRKMKKSGQSKPMKPAVDDNQSSKYLPNDEDFPDIRKFNEISPPKPKGESLYAATLAAVRKNDTDSRRQRKEGDVDSESESEDDVEEDHESENDDEEEDDGEGEGDGDDDESQESSDSEPESDEEANTTMINESKTQHLTSANLHDGDVDDDDADDVIVFQPSFSQQHPSPIGRLSTPPTRVMDMTTTTTASSTQHQPQSQHQTNEMPHHQQNIENEIDSDSLAYLQALHKKNTEKGWFTHESNQPSLSMEYMDKPSTHPFSSSLQPQSNEFAYWGSSHGNSEAALFNGFNFNGNPTHDGMYLDHPPPPPQNHNGYQTNNQNWSNQSQPYSSYVPPPPGFVDVKPSNPHSEDYPMNSSAATFLPTSLRQHSSPHHAAPHHQQHPQHPASSSSSSSSILSMLYGSNPEMQHHHHWNQTSSGYQSHHNDET